MTRTRRIFAIVAAVLVLAVGSSYVVSAAVAATHRSAPTRDFDDEIALANERAKAYEKRLEKLDAELEDTDAEIASAFKKLQKLEEQLPIVQAQLDTARERLNAALVQQGIVAEKLAAARAQDKAISDAILADGARIDELKLTIGALARDAYMGEGTVQSLELVFGSATSRQFVDRFAAQHSASRVQTNALDEIEQIAAVNRNREARQSAVRVYIEELKVQADALVVETNEARIKAEAKKTQIDGLIADQRKAQEYLASKRADALAQQLETERLKKKVQAQVLALVKKKLAAQAALNPTPLGKGYLSFPTKVPFVTSSYGMRFHPVLHYWRLHAGTDFRAYCGTPIYAAAEGRVVWSKFQYGYGNQVMVDHGIVKGNSLFSSYNHLTSFNVAAGQYVTRQTIVGYSGNSGTSSACHLHFEVYLNGNTVDPMTILGPIPK